MGSWRDLAATLREEGRSAPAPADAMPGVPDALADELRRLERATIPKVNEPALWEQAVADALRLARDGWAGNALGLGWGVTDLFGIGERDAYDFTGLAVWLAGRPVLMLNVERAVADTAAGVAYFNLGGLGHGADAKVEPVTLWQFERRP